jgi:hypothetical protein
MPITLLKRLMFHKFKIKKRQQNKYSLMDKRTPKKDSQGMALKKGMCLKVKTRKRR